jgi:transposase
VESFAKIEFDSKEKLFTPRNKILQKCKELMDNQSVHKVQGIREAIEAVGARLIYLPPYSPELSPIELCWSKIKEFLRTKAARTYDLLDQALAEAFEAVTALDAAGWFAHCGLPV